MILFSGTKDLYDALDQKNNLLALNEHNENLLIERDI